MIPWIIGLGVVVSVMGALGWAVAGIKRTAPTQFSSLTEQKPTAADSAMLSAVVSLVGEDDIDAAIEVLQLQRKRKNPPQ